MELTQEQFAQVSECLPRQRGNVKIENRQVLNAILYVAEQALGKTPFPGYLPR